MKSPFKVGQKVKTKVGGTESEAVVTKLWQNEVQVRTSDNELRWRTIYTVWYPGAAPLAREEKTAKSGVIAIGPNTAAKPATVKAKKAGRKQSRKRR